MPILNGGSNVWGSPAKKANGPPILDVRSPDGSAAGRPAAALRGGGAVHSRFAVAPLGENAARAGAGQPRANLLSVVGISDRPHAQQQHYESRRRSAGPERHEERRLELARALDQEPDAGLGNGGLGRLAACFIDSLATLQYSAIGYGLRYEYGIFRQAIRDGYQVEQPDNWLRSPDPWEVARPAVIYPVPLHGSFELKGSAVTIIPDRPSMLLGMAYDRPVAGYGAHCVNTLRLWAAAAPESFDFAEFSHGDFAGAVIRNVAAESVTRVLYPDDSTEAGRTLRFLQQYFMVSCSLQDIVHRFEQINGSNWQALPDHVAIQLNDTHPAIAVAELMRILLDRAFLTWEQAWDITVRTLAYTNHTLLPEALETWPVELFERLVPRHLDIIYEINRRFLDEVRRAIRATKRGLSA